jgi:hypothetical protein
MNGVEPMVHDRTYDFFVSYFSPNKLTGERINIGVLAYDADERAILYRFLDDFDNLKTVFRNVNLTALEKYIYNILIPAFNNNGYNNAEELVNAFSSGYSSLGVTAVKKLVTSALSEKINELYSLYVPIDSAKGTYRTYTKDESFKKEVEGKLTPYLTSQKVRRGTKYITQNKVEVEIDFFFNRIKEPDCILTKSLDFTQDLITHAERHGYRVFKVRELGKMELFLKRLEIKGIRDIYSVVKPPTDGSKLEEEYQNSLNIIRDTGSHVIEAGRFYGDFNKIATIKY